MPNVFKSITRLVYYSNGGFGFSELYNEVPVYVRRFLVKEIENIKKKEKEAMEGDGSSSSSSAPPDDIGKAMEKMEKAQRQSDKQVEKDLEEVFGPEEDRGNPDRTRAEDYMDKPPSQREPLHEQNEEPDVPDEQKTDGDPAKAKDLEQMIDKLKNDI